MNIPINVLAVYVVVAAVCFPIVLNLPTDRPRLYPSVGDMLRSNIEYYRSINAPQQRNEAIASIFLALAAAPLLLLSFAVDRLKLIESR